MIYMPLSLELQKNLDELTTKGEPNWQISRWLMNDCRLSFKEAAEEREQAIKRCGINYAQIKEKQKLNNEDGGEERSSSAVKIEDNVKPSSSLLFEITEIESPNPNSEKESVAEDKKLYEKTGCVSCGDPFFGCDCEVKTVAQIPF